MIISNNKKMKEEEISVAEWIKNTFGGNIKIINERLDYSKKSPDYLWDNKLWDLKTVSTNKAANSAVRSGLRQIKTNPGGIVLDYGNYDVEMQEIEKVILRRMNSSLYQTKNGVDIIVKTKDEVKVIKYKKKKR